MADLTKPSKQFPVGAGGRNRILGVGGGSVIYEGAMVAQLTATGMAVKAGTANSGAVKGVATHTSDATAVADGVKRIEIHTDRVFLFNNGAGGDAFSEVSQLYSKAYIVDDNTVADNDNGGARQVAGIFMGFEDDGKVQVYVGPFGAAGV